VVWPRRPGDGDGGLMMQRIAADGTVRLSPGGIDIVAADGEVPDLCQIVPAELGNVIVAWVKDTGAPDSERHVMAAKFTSAGAPAWDAPVSVYDETSVPAGYAPGLVADGRGGAIVYWQRSLADEFNSFVQRLDAGGAELFGHNGAAVGAAAGNDRLDPAVAYIESSAEIYAFWIERNSEQTQWGIYGQRFTAAGARAWGDDGFVFEPMNATYKTSIRSVPIADDAMVFWVTRPTGAAEQERIVGFRTDGSGVHPWGDPPIEVSSYLSSKGRPRIAIDKFGIAKLVWEDDRMGQPDIYAQNVNFNGTLGICECTVDPGVTDVAALRFFPAAPNPFRDRAVLNFELPRTSDVRLGVFDIGGRRVASLVRDRYPAGSYYTSWTGLNDAGERLPPGIYFGRVIADGATAIQKIVYLR
jgi:hypothetical protein